MSMIEAEVLVPWEERTDPSGMVYRTPAIDGEVLDWEDVTGQDALNIPPEPNLLLVCLKTDRKRLQVLRRDARCHVVWERDIANETSDNGKPTEVEREVLKQFMRRQGVQAEVAAQLADAQKTQESKNELAARLKMWLKARPASAVAPVNQQ